jgi:hypothetical protein
MSMQKENVKQSSAFDFLPYLFAVFTLKRKTAEQFIHKATTTFAVSK